ncbi:MAG: hypothetical protein ACJ8AW_53145 [Rhodopila sp.]
MSLNPKRVQVLLLKRRLCNGWMHFTKTPYVGQLRLIGRAFAVHLWLGLSAAVAPFLPMGEAAGAGHQFEICNGRFALCAASTCQPTGRSITVNVTTGGTASFPEYDCTCPILTGPAIADLTGGNMQGSCTPPPGQVWSLYAPRLQIPQAIGEWQRTGPESTAPPLICKANLNLGDKLVNCFSFACTPAGRINGVPVATCHCPLGESTEGTPVAPDTAFATQAGQGDVDICAKYPVAGAIPSIGMAPR